MVVIRTPYRISLFGGGTDYPVWWREHGGAVLGGAINKYCWISCRILPPFFTHRHRLVYSLVENFDRPEDLKHPVVREAMRWTGIHERMGLSLSHDGDLPARSGMGSSSSFTVGLLHAFAAIEDRTAEAARLAADAVHVEQTLIGEHVGNQDQQFAARGGFLRVRFHRDGSVDAETPAMPTGRLTALEDTLLLFFTGLSRMASEVAEEQVRNTRRKTGELQRMAEMVDEAAAFLGAPSWDAARFGGLLDEAWTLKRGLSSRITNPAIDDAVAAAKQAGAWGAKILGAGGGGFLLVMAPPERHDAVRAALPDLLRVPFSFTDRGSEIAVDQPGGLPRVAGVPHAAFA